MKKTMRILTLLLLMMVSAGQVWGQSTNLDITKATTITTGSVAFYSDAECSTEINSAAVGATVYIKATPDPGYTALGVSISVKKTINSDNIQAPRRTPGITDEIPVSAVQGKLDVYQFTMPDDENMYVTVDATFAAPAQQQVSYVDESYTTHTNVSAYVLDETMRVLPAGIYVVPNGLTLDYGIRGDGKSGTITFIIPDGKTLAIGSANSPCSGDAFGMGASLCFYGQTNATGKLDINATGNGISIGGSVTVAHLDVDIVSKNSNGIGCSNGVTIIGCANGSNTVKVHSANTCFSGGGESVTIKYCDVDIVSDNYNCISCSNGVTIIGCANGSNTVKLHSASTSTCIDGGNKSVTIKYCDVDVVNEGGNNAINCYGGVTIEGVSTGDKVNSLIVRSAGSGINTSNPITISYCNVEMTGTTKTNNEYNACSGDAICTGNGVTITGRTDANNTLKIRCGGKTSPNSYGIAGGQKAVSISRYNVNIVNENFYGIYTSDDVTITGGQVEITGGTKGAGIHSGNGNITLSKTSATDYFKVSSYYDSGIKAVKFADGQRFVAYNMADATDISATAIVSGSVTDLTTINGKTLKPLEGNFVKVDNDYVSIKENNAAKTADFTISDIPYYVYSANATVTLSAVTGYALSSASYNDGTDHDITATQGVYSFTMPANDVTVTATWKKLLTNTDISITIPIQEYTSSALTPVITVEDGSTPLIENTDYTVTLPEGRINAGNYTVTLTGIGNYDGKANETFTITPVPVTLTANSRNTDTYDGTQKFVTGFTSSVDNLTFTGVSASASGTNAGDYDVTFSGVTVNTTTDTSGNYVITGTTNGKLTINPASVTLTANSRNTDTYDGTQKTVTGFTSSVNGLSFAETVTASGSGTNAGDYDVTFSGVTVNTTKDNTGNYVVTGTTNGTLTINPASVTLTANSDTKEYSGAEQSVTGYTCSVNGLTFAGVTASGSGTNVGTYDVTFSGVTVNTTKDNTGNYVVTNTTNGTLTINAKVTDYGALEVNEDEKGMTATIDGSETGTINITSDVTVDNVSLSRTFTANEAATLMLPFAIDVANASGAAFYTYTGVTFNTTTNKWEATMTQISSGTIAANTPYVVMPSDAAITFTGSVTLNTTGGGGQQTTNGDWTFKGTYEEKTWTAAECGNDYGFAAADGISTDGHTAVKAGDFVKLAAGAHIKPGRSYLTYTGTGNPWASTNAPKHRTGADLPQSISVVLVNSDGSTTEIGASLVNSEERIVNSGAWFTLDGRKLDKQPTTKGVYIHEGKKHVIR